MARMAPRSPGVRPPSARRGLVASLAALGLLVASGCASTDAATPDFQVRGVGVMVNSVAPFTRHQDFPARVESTIDAALAYWGGSWAALNGKTITFDGDQHVACEGNLEAIGCYDGSIRVSTSDLGTAFDCVEETVLVHEIGHAVIGDPDHTDPRWMDFTALQQDLAGRPGYDAQGETSCRLYPSVWRHPPAQR
jgi:hypothetical protein